MGYKHNIEEVIDKGIRLFQKNGYNHVGISDVLEASGISKGSFYHFFNNKADFAVRVIKRYEEISLLYIQSFTRDRQFSPLGRLRRLYRDIIDQNIANGMDAGCMLNVLSMDVGAQHAAIGNAANDGFVHWIQEIASCVRAGQKQGEIRTDFTAEDIAEYLHAGVYGGFSRMKVTHSVDYLNRWYKMAFAFISGK